jgi:putative peptide zinc metalloprotease protein
MVKLLDSIVSSSSRKLAIRVRPDLAARKQRYQGRTYWVVKDPVGLQYYRFEEEEFAILQMLDGQSSLEQIAERFEREFPPQTIRVEELQNFIGMLHKGGLVLSDAAGQGAQLKQRRDEKKRRELLASLANLLAFRLRGFDPERLLNAMYPYVRWFFSGPATCGALLLAFAAAALVLVQFNVFQSRLPDFHSFFAAQNWLLLAGVLMTTKVIHEFGHGLSCKHFGGECHEMGVMFLVLTPCLYCNVSDSWMLPNRWHRAAIGAAGMYVEVVLASIATFVWWFSEPGWLNYLALNVMFVSSVSTILFNANPLLRYDGYYILSDLLEIPNLRQKAQSILNRKLRLWCLGIEDPEDPFLPKRHQGLFALYTVASFVYRWVVLLSILVFLNRVFEPYGLKVLGQIIALGSVYGLVAMPLWNVFKFFRVPGRWSKVKRVRMFATVAVLAAAAAALCLIPFPSSIVCPFEVQPYAAVSVYVEVEGVLRKPALPPGTRVAQGDLIAELDNVDLRLEVARLRGEAATQEVELTSLRNLRTHDEQYALQLEVASEKLAATVDQLAQKETDLRRLRIVAPAAGVIIPPARVPEQGRQDEVQLASWTGSPLDPHNVGATFSPGGSQNLLCSIGDPEQWEAVIVVDQDDVDLVQEGQAARLLLEEAAWHEFAGVIAYRAADAMETAPARLASTSGGPLPCETDPLTGNVRPLSTSYQAVVRLDNASGLIRNGLTGRARIDTGPRTLVSRLWRYFSRTFNFDL